MSFNTALTGMLAASQRIDTSGHNIANVGTVGYKSDKLSFADIYENATKAYNEVGVGTYEDASYKSFKQGVLRGDTNGSEKGELNVALNGSGFFMLNDPRTNKVTYTRNGEYMLNKSGEIVSKVDQNLRLMGMGNSTFTVDKSLNKVLPQTVTYTDGTTGTITRSATYNRLDINTDGEILVSYDLQDNANTKLDTTKTLKNPPKDSISISLGKISLTEFISPEKMLTPIGDNQFVQTKTGISTVTTAGSNGTGTIMSKTLEESNVELVEQLIHLMEFANQYRANSQGVTAQNQMIQTAINNL